MFYSYILHFIFCWLFFLLLVWCRLLFITESWCGLIGTPNLRSNSCNLRLKWLYKLCGTAIRRPPIGMKYEFGEFDSELRKRSWCGQTKYSAAYEVLLSMKSWSDTECEEIITLAGWCRVLSSQCTLKSTWSGAGRLNRFMEAKSKRSQTTRLHSAKFITLSVDRLTKALAGWCCVLSSQCTWKIAWSMKVETDKSVTGVIYVWSGFTNCVAQRYGGHP